MGKSKTRILRKGINNQLTKITRDDAVVYAVDYLKNSEVAKAKDLITLFNLSAEDLLEAGANYESIIAIRNIFG